MKFINIVRKFRSKFFAKILITYIFIIVITISSIIFIMTKNISSMLVENDISFNKQILLRVNSYIENKFLLVQNINKAMYIEDNFSGKILSMLKKNSEISSQEYPLEKIQFNNFFKWQLTRDIDISALMIYSNADKSIYLYPKSYNNVIYANDYDMSHIISLLSHHSFGSIIVPSRLQNYMIASASPPVYTYSFIQNIKDPVNFNDIGVLAVDFKSNDVKNSYKEYESDVKGYILILDASGNVIFDSSERYYNSKYPYFELIVNSPKEAVLDEKCIVNVYHSSIPGIFIAGIIPESQIYKKITELKNTIYMLSILFILFAFLLSFISMIFFSGRVKAIICAMKKVRKGDFTVRIPLYKNNDEINEIAFSFNQMCEDLKNHIDKVYVAGLKQKSAELNALQAQVNPHFLYNTLEAIRLRAITKGDEDTGEMIYILGSLFRNLIKEELIIFIKDEIKYCEMYLQLFMVRYEERLTIKFDICKEILEYGIIKHLIQPILENYFIHGIRSENYDNSLCINAFPNNENIVFEFIDNGFGINAEKIDKITKQLKTFSTSDKSSIGLGNVNERIKIFYGQEYGIKIKSTEGSGTTITLTIPMKTKSQLKSELKKYV